MTPHDAGDPLMQNLTRLGPLTPDLSRAERVRGRCRAQLERHRRHSVRAAVVAGFARRVLTPVVVGGLCVLYVAALVGTTLRLHHVFN